MTPTHYLFPTLFRAKPYCKRLDELHLVLSGQREGPVAIVADVNSPCYRHVVPVQLERNGSVPMGEDDQ